MTVASRIDILVMTYYTATLMGLEAISSVCIATGYGLDDRDSIPGRGKKFLSTPQRPASI
jgi:hypothetical protein